MRPCVSLKHSKHAHATSLRGMHAGSGKHREARRGAEERVRAFRQILAKNNAAQAMEAEAARAKQRAARARRRSDAELKRVRVHALNILLAKSDAAEVLQKFGAGAGRAAGGGDVRV